MRERRVAWSVGTGILFRAEGLRATFRALGLKAEVVEEEGAIRFAAARVPGLGAALLGAAFGASAVWSVDAADGSRMLGIAAAISLGLLVPRLLPRIRVDGRIAGGRFEARLSVGGLFARVRAIEDRLRFFLERP